MLRRMLFAGLLLGWVALGCGDRPPDEIDLLSLAELGDWRIERSLIPVDQPDAPEFGYGWSRPRETRDGFPFRWAIGDASELRVLCVEPKDLELKMVVRPFTWEGAPRQSVIVELNGGELGVWEILRRTTLGVSLPAAALHPGDNVIVFRWAYAQRPDEVGSIKARRRRAVAVSELAIAGLAHEAAPERGETPGRGLELPAAAQLGLAVWTGAGALLDIELAEGSAAGLQVWARREGEELERLWSDGGRRGGRRVPLGDGAGPVEIVLRTAASPAGGPVVVERARVVWPSPSPPAAEETAVPKTRPDILLFVVDTLRADRLSCYGGPPGISPALDRLAADGILFERAVAQSSWTKPSMVSVLSGLLTTEHGVRRREPRIPSEVTLVAERLRSAGYRTGGFTSNAYLVEAAGFARGFEHYDFAHERAEAITRRALEWLQNVPEDAPTFTWIHTIDPHAPYEPEEPYRTRWAPDVAAEVGSFDHVRWLARQPLKVRETFKEDYLALYDAEVAQNDAAFGRVLSWLEARGRYQDTVVVFLSDHGEGFWEHGVNGHGWDLYEEVLRVPLVIKPAGPGWAGQRHREIVQHVDLVPTLLEAAGLDVPDGLVGRSLLKPEKGDEGGRVAFSEMTYEGREGLAVRWRQYKLIEALSRNFLPLRALYDLDRDPGETNPVTNRPVISAWLALEGRRNLARLSLAPEAGEDVKLDAAAREALEALGYLDAPGVHLGRPHHKTNPESTR